MTTLETPAPVTGYQLLAYVVTRKVRETGDTVTLHLSPSGPATTVPRPGQFNMLYAFGIGEVPISVSGASGTAVAHTIRAVGAVTTALCALEPGEVVGVRGPYGTPWPLERALGRDLVIVAGGIGLAPLRQAIVDVFRHRERHGSFSVVYGARTPEDLLFVDDLRTWRSRFDVEVEVTVDRATPTWRGDVGVVTPLLDRVEFDPTNVVCMLCGPEVMMRVVARALAERGVDDSEVFLSLERNMKCAIGFCGHCQFGPELLCRDGPVVPYSRVGRLLGVNEL